MDTFLPKAYVAPEKESNYFKLKKGTNTFRVLSSAIVGYEYWTKENKPVRSRKAWESLPEDAKVDSKTGNFQKHFWAFLVYDYTSQKVKILELTQSSVMDVISDYVANPKWGSPVGYDLVVKADGDGMERKYSTIAEPHTPAPVINIPFVDLEELYRGGDPFKATTSDGTSMPSF